MGGALVNGFPLGQTWFQSNNNTSAGVGVDLLVKGENEIELVLLVSEKGGDYTFQFEDSEGGKVFDARIKTTWNALDDEDATAADNVGEITVEWLVPNTIEKTQFVFEKGKQLLLSLNKDEDSWSWEKSTKEGKLFKPSLDAQIILRIPYFSERGADAVPPWIGAERYQKSEFLEVKNTVGKYAELLVGKDVTALEPLCDERWKWQALSHDESYAERKQKVENSFQKHRNLLLGKVEISQVDVFPLTSLIRISGNQVGLSLNGQSVYLEVLLFKKNNQWKIAL